MSDPLPASTPSRVSFERLRERTDELELIISGLSLFALLSVPGLLFDLFEQYFARMTMGYAAAAVVVLSTLPAIAYSMAALFVLHLAVRAHWVGLIGLKSAFPHGIRWERLRGLGSVTTDRLQRTATTLDAGIESADRLASILFSLITFSALSLGILGAWVSALFVLAGVFGTELGGTNAFINRSVPILVLVMITAPLLRWLLDGVLARRFTRLPQISGFRRVIAVLSGIEGLFFPQRLLGTARLTLQSNTLPRVFFPLFVGAIVLVSFYGNQSFQQARGFDVLGSQSFVSGRALTAGQRSLHYESQRVALDRLRPSPLIPAPVIETAWLPLFLPYMALIDDPVLEQRCPARTSPPPQPFGFDSQDSDLEAQKREAESERLTQSSADCLRQLWQVSLDGRPQSLDTFLPSERADLGLRGLSGYLPLAGLAAGPHRLEVIWRPQPERDQIAQDYVPRRTRYVIPFLWSPEAAVKLAK